MFSTKSFCVLLYVFFLSCNLIVSQTVNKSKIDSLSVLVSKVRQDTVKVDLLNKMFTLSKGSDLELLNKYNSQLYILSKKNNYLKGIGYYYFNGGEVDTRLGKTESALKKISKSAAIFMKVNSDSDYAMAMYCKANLLLTLNRGDEGFEIVSKVLKGYINTDNYKELSYLYFYCGIYYNAQNDFANSLVYLNKAIFYAKKVDCLAVLLNSYDNIVDICFKSNRWKMALEYSSLEIEVLDAIESNQGGNYFLTKAVAYNKNSNINRHFSYYEKALAMAELALKNAERSKKENVVANCLNLTALIHFECKRYYKSIGLAEIVIKDYDKSNSFTLQVLGKNYFMLGDYSRSAAYLNESLLNRNFSTNTLTEYYLPKYSIYEDLAYTSYAQRDYKSAFKFSGLFYQGVVKDLKVEKKEGILELQTRFDVKIKDLELARLSSEHKSQVVTISQSRYKFIAALLSFFALLIILSFVVYFFYKNKKTSNIILLENIELRRTKALVEESLKIKQILLNEIHHRVKNNLQMVISLINIQARHSKNISIADFLERTESRVLVLALIYENLSEHESVEDVFLQDYVGNLVSNIFEVLDIDRLTFSLNTEGIILDIQSSIFLGLIINEMVCNSIKHAFPGGATGEIKINLKKRGADCYLLSYRDNGVGQSHIEKSKKSLGLNLINLLVQQMEGTLECQSLPSFSCEISFKVIS